MTRWIIFMIVMSAFWIAFQYIMIKRGNLQGQYLNAMLKSLNDEEQFFIAAKEGLEKEKNPEFLEKIKLMKAWGEAYYEHFDAYAETIETVDLQRLVSNGKKSRVKENEDAFFYLHLIIPNRLYGCGQKELLNSLQEKMESIKKETENTLTYHIFEANMNYYNRTGDLGEQIYGEVLSGDYGGYTYSKQLIGIYKNIVTAMLAAVYKETGDNRRYNELNDDLTFFASMPLGLRWLKALGLPIPRDVEVREEDKKPMEEKEVKEIEHKEDTEEKTE